jgi:hypothetical protein
LALAKKVQFTERHFGKKIKVDWAVFENLYAPGDYALDQIAAIFAIAHHDSFASERRTVTGNGGAKTSHRNSQTPTERSVSTEKHFTWPNPRNPRNM